MVGGATPLALRFPGPDSRGPWLQESEAPSVSPEPTQSCPPATTAAPSVLCPRPATLPTHLLCPPLVPEKVGLAGRALGRRGGLSPPRAPAARPGLGVSRPCWGLGKGGECVASAGVQAGPRGRQRQGLSHARTTGPCVPLGHRLDRSASVPGKGKPVSREATHRSGDRTVEP